MIYPVISKRIGTRIIPAGLVKNATPKVRPDNNIKDVLLLRKRYSVQKTTHKVTLIVRILSSHVVASGEDTM